MNVIGKIYFADGHTEEILKHVDILGASVFVTQSEVYVYKGEYYRYESLSEHFVSCNDIVKTELEDEEDAFRVSG